MTHAPDTRPSANQWWEPSPVARHYAPPPRARRQSGDSGGVVASAVGVVGELLVTAGVILGLFVVWQLWWTDVEGDRAQAEIIAGLDWTPPPAEPAGPAVATQHRAPEAPPVAAPPTEGEVFGQLYVPRWGADYVKPIAEGVEKESVLDTIGIGHYPDTAMPGDLGNFSTAAHRTTYGKPFHLIADLQAGDPVVVRTEDTWYVYRVTESKIVTPWQTEVVAPVPGLKAGDPLPELTQRFITLTSCHPMYSAKERYIVHGELDYWAPVSEGTPQELLDAGISFADGGL
ncbi:class E sortase [Antribacter gilvus]|uniref:class E sortase n=1 Tax=Antribacter gilvus TaxID=2304675 RepID=UPI001F0BD5BA|nr:class E sortase [Antribacter gilvus]